MSTPRDPHEEEAATPETGAPPGAADATSDEAATTPDESVVTAPADDDVAGAAPVEVAPSPEPVTPEAATGAESSASTGADGEGSPTEKPDSETPDSEKPDSEATTTADDGAVGAPAATPPEPAVAEPAPVPPAVPTAGDDPQPDTDEIEIVLTPQSVATPVLPARAAADPARTVDDRADAATTPDSSPGAPGAEQAANPAESTPASRTAGWSAGQRLRSAFRPRFTRAQVLAAVLCAVLGFALAVQLQQNQEDELSGLRQSDLVRILDDVSRRSDSLEREATSLREAEFDLRSGSDSQQAALDLAEKNAAIQGILSGRLPAQGPGLEITITEGDKRISAARLFNVLEELRNAGAEAIEVNSIRMVTSSYFQDTDRGMVIDGISVTPPYRWAVIGDPQTLEPAIAIPGGAMATITTNGGRTTIQQKELVQIRSVRDPADPQYAEPVPDEG